jgi:hypothetical protein
MHVSNAVVSVANTAPTLRVDLLRQVTTSVSGLKLCGLKVLVYAALRLRIQRQRCVLTSSARCDY